MPDQSPFSNLPRKAALRLESFLQEGLDLGAKAGALLRPDLSKLRCEDFRGRACHCDPGLALHLVHSEGLREASDFVVDFGTNVRHAERPSVQVSALAGPASQLPAGAIVHVKTDLLSEFVAQVLPSISRPIVLVTGDSDHSAGPRHAALLQHPMIAHWFGQNCDFSQRPPKFTRLPIGFDNPVYTKVEKRLGFVVTMALGRTPLDLSCSRNDMGDQALLQEISKGLPPLLQRPLRALCTFHQNQKIIRPDLHELPDRAEAWRRLSQNPTCHFVERRLPQRECWKLHGEFSFEVSPQGNGLDCFRTWEALVLGVIPIVKTSHLDPLYEDEALPVVVVNDWNEISGENLFRWRRELAGRFTPDLLQKLSLGHWVAKIRKMASSVSAG